MSIDNKKDHGDWLTTAGDTKKFTVLIHSEDDSSAPLMVAQIERTGPLNAATFGLTLAESKSLLANVQKELVESQLQCFVTQAADLHPLQPATHGGPLKIITPSVSRVCLAE